MLTLDRCCFANLFLPCFILENSVCFCLPKDMQGVRQCTIHSFVSNVLCGVTFTRPASAYIFRLCLQSIFLFCRQNRSVPIQLGNRHTLCKRFGKGLACVGPSGRQNLPTIKVYQPTAGMNRVTIV